MKILLIHIGTVPVRTPNRKTNNVNLDELLSNVGGGTRRFLEICKKFSSEDEVSVYAHPEILRILEYYHIHFKNVWSINTPFEFIFSRSQNTMIITYFLRIIKTCFLKTSTNFDIVFSTDHQIHDLFPAYFISIKTGAKLVTYVHHLIPSPFSRSRSHSLIASIMNWLSQNVSFFIMKRYVAKIFNLGWSWIDELKSRGIPSNKLIVLNEGIDINYIEEISKRVNDYDAFFVGRIDPIKGVFDLVDVWSIISDHISSVTLAIIGSGPELYVQRLQDVINDRKLNDNILLLNRVPESDKFALLKTGKLFLFPSYEEGWGIAICEAMACGLPVVAYDLPAYRNVFKQGMVRVPVGNKKEMAMEVIKLFEDKDYRERLSNNAMIQAYKYDWNKTIDEEMNILFNILTDK